MEFTVKFIPVWNLDFSIFLINGHGAGLCDVNYT